jgi:7-cyano-7-deazaguanine synthase
VSASTPANDPVAVVLHSGGLDSTVCVLLATEQKRRVVSLGINYGQRHSIELAYATQQAEKLGVERRVLEVKWDKPPRPLPRDRTVSEIRQGRSSAFLPGRNLVFLSLAVAEAAGLGADEVWTGINAVDFSGYPDCTPSFLSAFVACAAEGIPEGPKVVAPLIGLSKPQIAAEAKRLGVGRDDTWSCYRPVLGDGGVRPCGRCDACVLHEYAWRDL